jgi:hypothetical protein
MIRTPKGEYRFNVTSCQIVNDGVAFLRIHCANIPTPPGEQKTIRQYNAWHLDGAGGPIKVKEIVIHRRHHMPSLAGAIVEGAGASAGAILDPTGFGTGTGWFTYDLQIDLYMPKGVFDIQFSKYNDEREAYERQQKAKEAEERAKLEAAKSVSEEKKKPKRVDTFRKRFGHIDARNEL